MLINRNTERWAPCVSMILPNFAAAIHDYCREQLKKLITINRYIIKN